MTGNIDTLGENILSKATSNSRLLPPSLKMRSMVLLALCTVTEAFYTAIPSGHVGVYSWMGQIQPNLQKGVNLYNPLTSEIRHVKYIQDTDSLKNLRCVSKEGVNIEIPSIEIANRINPESVISVVSKFGFNYDTVLVLNPLGQRMRELCAERTVDEIEITDFHALDDRLKEEIQTQVDAVNSGITIDWVRITNVIIPPEIKQKRLELAAEKANKLLVEERGKRIAIEKQQEALVQKADNERALAATKLQAEQIEALAIANAEAARLEAISMQTLYAIPGYVEVMKVQALKDNMKVYFGDNLPGNMFLGAPLPTCSPT
jgi:regulator of protease activity HflC (stomatin/prohibitin superfamily)